MEVRRKDGSVNEMWNFQIKTWAQYELMDEWWWWYWQMNNFKYASKILKVIIDIELDKIFSVWEKMSELISKVL